MDAAGHTFGIVLVAVVVAQRDGGVATAAAMDRTAIAPATRRRSASRLIALAGLLPVAARWPGWPRPRAG